MKLFVFSLLSLKFDYDSLDFCSGCHVTKWPVSKLCRVLQESYPSTPPIWFVDSDDPSLAEVLERLEDVRKGSTLVSRSGHSASPWTGHLPRSPGVRRQADCPSQITFFVSLVGPTASPATEAPHL